MLLEMGEKGSVREVLQTGCIVGHAVFRSWDKEADMTVAVLALVHAGVVAEVSSCPLGGDSAFCDPREGRSVVCASSYGGIAGVVVLGDDTELAHESSLFQVTVGDFTRRVVEGHQASLHFFRKGQSPHVSLASGIKVDSTHAWLCCVGSTKEGRFLGHYFSQVRRSVAKAGTEAGKGINVGAEAVVDADSVSF